MYYLAQERLERQPERGHCRFEDCALGGDHAGQTDTGVERVGHGCVRHLAATPGLGYHLSKLLRLLCSIASNDLEEPKSEWQEGMFRAQGRLKTREVAVVETTGKGAIMQIPRDQNHRKQRNLEYAADVSELRNHLDLLPYSVPNHESGVRSRVVFIKNQRTPTKTNEVLC